MNDYDRTPPHDEHAEMAVLGGMLMHRDAIEEVASLLAGTSFYLPKHEQVFDAIIAVDARDQPADAVTVAAELQRRGELAKIGGPGYLHTLMAAVPTAANAGYYAYIVREHKVRRRLIEIGTRFVQMGYETTDAADIPEMIDQAQALAMTLDHIAEDDEEDFTLGDAYIEVLESAEHGIAKGLPTGLRDFDELTGGMQPGQLIVVAARPALGKSVVAENWVRHTAIRTGRPAAMFSLEMSRFEIAKRAIAAEGTIGLHHLAPGKMTDGDWDRVNTRTKNIPAAPLYVDENPNQTINSIRSKARKLKRKHGIELLAVDYLQLMEAEAKRRGGDNRQQDVSAISRGLKLLAKELQIPVIAVAQLNRGPETRADKKPAISDLRESGSIENDADIVVLIHREAAYDEESPRAGEADLIVAKHRGGPKATLTVAFQGHYARFVDMART